MEWLGASLVWLTLLIMVISLFGLIIPVFPGLVVIWVSALGYGLLTGFTPLAIVIFILLTLLMLLGVSIDNILMGVGARKGGASWKTIAVALVAAVLGTFLWPPIGGFIAAPVAVYGMEYLRLRNREQAWSALRGLAAGLGISFVLRFIIGVMMIALWLIWVWQG